MGLRDNDGRKLNGKLKAKNRVWRLDPELDGAVARAGATRTAFSVYRGDGDLDEHIAHLTTRTRESRKGGNFK